jgi:hypothetical protein
MFIVRFQRSFRRRDFNNELVFNYDDSLIKNISFILVPKRNTDLFSH